MDFLDTALTTIIYLASCFLLFYLGKLTYQFFHRKINVKNELVEKDNFAFALAHAGYFIGLLLAIGSAVIGPSRGLAQDMIDIFIYGILSIPTLDKVTSQLIKSVIKPYLIKLAMATIAPANPIPTATLSFSICS